MAVLDLRFKEPILNSLSLLHSQRTQVSGGPSGVALLWCVCIANRL